MNIISTKYAFPHQLLPPPYRLSLMVIIFFNFFLFRLMLKLTVEQTCFGTICHYVHVTPTGHRTDKKSFSEHLKLPLHPKKQTNVLKQKTNKFVFPQLLFLSLWKQINCLFIKNKAFYRNKLAFSKTNLEPLKTNKLFFVKKIQGQGIFRRQILLTVFSGNYFLPPYSTPSKKNGSNLI